VAIVIVIGLESVGRVQAGRMGGGENQSGLIDAVTISFRKATV